MWAARFLVGWQTAQSDVSAGLPDAWHATQRVRPWIAAMLVG